MLKRRSFLALTSAASAIALAFGATFAFAGEGHKHAKTNAAIGEAAPQFTLSDVVTGESHTLADFEGKHVVLIWQSINCPWDKMREDGGYQRILNPLAEKYQAEEIVFVAINSNRTESVDEVAEYATKHSIPYPILKDANNVIADAYGAKTTPHIFIIAPDQTLAYKGGIEEVPSSPAMCGQMDVQYLAPVLDAMLAGETLPFTETKSKGCSIKRVKK